MIRIFYGEMGSGKSYWGKKFAEFEGINFIEGDDFLPEALKHKVDRAQLLTPEEVDSYIRDCLIPALKKIDQPTIVSQALYRREHRKLISNNVDNVEWVLITAPFFQHMKQLFSRKHGFKWVVNALLSKVFFEK